MKANFTNRVILIWNSLSNHVVSADGMTKYRKGPTKEHYTKPQRIGNTAKDPQRTAKEHYGLRCRKLAPIELIGALPVSLYSSARQDFSHAAGLS